MQALSVTQSPSFGHTVDHSVGHTIDHSVGRTVDHTVGRTASAAHHVVDSLADQTLTGVAKVSGSLHVAVNHTADAVSHAAEWVAHVPAQVAQKKTRLSSAAFATIRARPFVTLGGAIALGYIIGRLSRR